MPGSTELDEWHHDPLWWKSESSGLWPGWPDPWLKESMISCYLYTDQPPRWLTCYNATFCWETLSPWSGLVLACLTDAWSDWDLETLSSLSYLARQVDLWDYVITGPQKYILLDFKLWTHGQVNSVLWGTIEKYCNVSFFHLLNYNLTGSFFGSTYNVVFNWKKMWEHLRASFPSV